MRMIHTDAAAQPAGHYSQAVVNDNMVFISGQLAVTADGQKHTEASIERQTEIAMDNIREVLVAAGSDLKHLLSVTMYITDIEDWPKVNATYARILGNHKPARAVVPVPVLHYGFLIEIQATAKIRENAAG